MKPEFDDLTGEHTTGHEWNGIKELNTPMPKAFRIWLWLSIAVCVVLWILYPSFPTVSAYAKGVLGYSSRMTVAERVDEGQAQLAAAFAPFEDMDVTDLATAPTLKAMSEPEISVLYRDNCAACHGRDAQGQTGFPSLTDDHWLWSGTPEEIEYTLRHGVNSADPDTRYAEMPAFGREEWLERSEIVDVVEYVLQISGQEHDQAAAKRGTEVFDTNCVSCHETGGIGGLENGAPSLTDSAWIYGGDRSALRETLRNGRTGVMPYWTDRLTAAEIRQLTLYVYWLSNDAEN